MRNEPDARAAADDPCAPLRELLSPHLDGELTEREAADLARHLEHCDACRSELAELRAVVERVAADLRDLPEEAPPAPPAPPRPMGLPRPESEAPSSPNPGVEGRPIPLGLRVAAAALFLVFVGTWLFDGTDSGLRARAAEVAAELARPGTSFRVHARPPELADAAPARPEDELVHLFAHGPRGSYLWQLADEDATAFDPDRYLLGCDGAELWTWDPAASAGRTLPVAAVPAPLPRALSELFADLEASALLSFGEVRARGTWREVEVAAGPGFDAARVRFLFTAEDELFGLEVLPRPDLAVFVQPLTERPRLDPGGFALAPRTVGHPEADLLALDPPEQPQPDALWQLGYTPGAPPTTWPEQLSNLATELGALGYL